MLLETENIFSERLCEPLCDDTSMFGLVVGFSQILISIVHIMIYVNDIKIRANL